MKVIPINQTFFSVGCSRSGLHWFSGTTVSYCVEVSISYFDLVLIVIDTSYNILVRTGTEWFGGTDALVYMTLYSKTSKSKNLALVGSFERGNIDRFDFTLLDLGK